MTIRGLLRTLRRSFSGDPISGEAFRKVDRHFRRARHVVKGYYLLSILFSAAAIAQIHETGLMAQDWDFLWPVSWLSFVEPGPASDWLALAWLAASIAAFQFTGRRVARVLFSVTMLQVAAVANSLGGMNHLYHAWFWVGAVLIFLPDGPGRRSARSTKMTYLSVVAGCQTLLLGFYTLSGFIKFGAGGAAMSDGVTGNFSANVLAETLAHRILQTGTSPLLADIVIDHAWLAQPLFLPLIFVQMVAVIAAFRPRLHRIWGYAIIAFHVGTWVLMEIFFYQHVALLALFLVASPFAPRRTTVREVAADIPIIGPLINLLPIWPGRKPRLEPELPAAE